MSEMPKRIWAWFFVKEKRDDVIKGGWDDVPDKKEAMYVHSATLRTVLDMLNSNASRENIRRVIEVELGGDGR